MEANTKPATGKLAYECGGLALPLSVIHSQAGYYLGTTDDDGAKFTRESREYWAEREEAQRALDSGDWTQRLVP